MKREAGAKNTRAQSAVRRRVALESKRELKIRKTREEVCERNVRTLGKRSRSVLKKVKTLRETTLSSSLFFSSFTERQPLESVARQAAASSRFIVIPATTFNA